MVKGICPACKADDFIYKESQLCLKCFELSKSAVKEYECKSKIETGKCLQCKRVTNISSSVKLCK
jgi:hypothetical protein